MAEYKAKWPDAEGIIHWSDEENSTWKYLYERQMKLIGDMACDEFCEGLDLLNFSADQVPQLNDVNQVLERTGWRMVPVSGTIPVTEFFSLLKHKQFPVANFIRVMDEVDYLTQPDVFHELFGHAPLLTHQVYAA